MSDRTPLFLFFGLSASVLLAIGLAMMKSRSAALPAARGMTFLGAIGRWFSDPVWLGGLALQTGGYVIYLVALSGAPISLLAVTMQGGIALFVMVAVLFLRERANPREWIGIAGIVAAIFLLTLSLSGGATASVTNSALLVLLSAVVAIAAIFTFLAERHQPTGIASAIASGLAFGMGSLYAKAVVEMLAGIFSVPMTSVAFTVLTTPWTYLAVAANLGGLVLLQNSFHAARGIIVMPLSSACSNLVPIVGGIVAFGERLPAANGPALLRISAFALTVLAGGLLATSRQ
jgi:multidrug transporter EmrE-like cation transporter